MSNKLDCKDVSRLLSRSQDQTLPEDERARMRLHLVICQTCRTVDQQMAFMRRAMRGLGSKEPPQD
jgi:predicted anti-sigma-YlaC factor YlaD